MRDDNDTGKGTSGMDKFSSKVHGVHMELVGKLPNSLRIEAFLGPKGKGKGKGYTAISASEGS